MKSLMFLLILFLLSSKMSPCYSQNDALELTEEIIKKNKDLEEKAQKWLHSLPLDDQQKIDRLKQVILTHLIQVRDWHNTHPFTEVPAGINPFTGNDLTELDRRIIAHSAKPKVYHQHLMEGLRRDLSENLVTKILDEYTVGKVDFTMKGYHAIVPDLTTDEASYIRKLLETAREEAIDYKNMEEISAIFEIYKTKAENYLNSNGRNWRQLYKDYVNKS